MLYIEPTLEREKITNIVSPYNPPKKVKERLAQLREEYQVAQTIMDRPFEEFGFDDNGMMYSLVTRLNYNQKKFNLFRPPRSVDPDLSWHSNALKPIIRNKVIAIVAHVTSQVLYPDVIAQNEDSTEDKDMASVMKDAVIWACEQSKYEDMFVDAVQEMCVNPTIILYQDYTEVKRKIKEKIKGRITVKEIVDEIYSGFIAAIVPPDELYIGNIYEPNIQKQPFLIRRKIIDYSTAERKYGSNPDFKHVQKGRTVFFDAATDLFYEDADEQLDNRLVEEATYYNRFLDLELVVVGGVLMTDPDEPMRRQDKCYPFAKSEYETFNSRFFYGMALVQKLEPDEDNLTTLHRMFIDGTYLQMMPPINVYGEQNVTASDFAPRSINTFTDTQSRVEALQLSQNLTAGQNAIQYTEQSMADSSKQDYQPRSDTTAREIAYMEEQTKLSLGRTGKMIAKLVREYGQLLVNSIVQYLPVAKVGEVVGDDTALKFPTLFLADQDEDGTMVSKKIEFTTDMPEAESQEELDKLEEAESFKALDTREKLGMSISKVDPEIFRNLKYTVKVKASFISESTKFAKAMMMFDRLAGDPDINQKKLKKDTILKELKPGHEQDYIADEQPVMDEVEKLPNTAKAQPPALNNAAFNI